MIEMDVHELATPILAGYMAGGMTMLIHHPIESLKVLQQTENTAAAKAAASSSTSTTTSSTPAGTTRNLSTINSITGLGKRSITSLYAGISGPLITVGLVQSLNFALYDGFRKYLHQKQHSYSDTVNNSKDYLYNDSLRNVLISSTATGAVISFVTSPIFVLKTKQQITRRSFQKTVVETLKHRSFFVGFVPHFICETLYRTLYFTSYEYFKRSLLTWDTSLSNPLPLVYTMACAGVSGFLTWSIIYPVDVIRSKMYAQAALTPNKPEPLNSFEMTRYVWNQGGWRLFYRGMFFNVLRLVPVQMTLLPTYDVATELLLSS